jgi:hypothetical protein
MMELVQSGIPISNITIFITIHYKINADYGTLSNMRNDHIQELVDMCKAKPGGSSVDKLITLFGNTKNVSYVYLLHKYDTGLVTMRKKQGGKNKTNYWY